MGIIGTIIIGLIVGLIARFLKPGDDSMGWIMTILLGIGGSLLATYGGQALGHQMRAMYDPVIDEALDPRLAELLQQLDADRSGST
ncbi:NepR family anti-sigma factor [Methylobacterium organophilum]|nr:NepR family anti-sigma factor [Methylobacterium organophilum]